MDWFRAYHGISTDPKLHKASRKAKVSRGLMVGAWIAVLETASQSADRGSLDGLDPETLAYLIDQPLSVATRVFGALVDLGLIVDGRVHSWAKRQRPSDDVAARVRSFRAKSAGPGDDPNSNLLPQNDTLDGGNVTVSPQNREDKSRDSNHDEPESHVAPAAPTAGETARAHIWRELVDFLGGGEGARSLIGRMVADHGDGAVFSAYFATLKQHRSSELANPKTYMLDLLKAEPARKGLGGFRRSEGPGKVEELDRHRRQKLKREIEAELEGEGVNLFLPEGMDELGRRLKERLAGGMRHAG